MSKRLFHVTLVSLLAVGLCLVAGSGERCPSPDELESAPVLSYHQDHAKNFRFILTTIEDVTGSSIATGDLVGRFTACINEAMPRCQSQDFEGSTAPDSMAACLPVTIESNATHITVNTERRDVTIPLTRSPWKISSKVTRLIVEEAPSDRHTQVTDAIWHVWVETALATLGQEFSYFTYADQLSLKKARSKGKSFGPGFWPQMVAEGIRVAEISDPRLVDSGLAVGDIVTTMDGELNRDRLFDPWLESTPRDYELTVAVDGAIRTINARTVPLRHRTLTWQQWRGVVYVRIDRFAEDSLIEFRRMARNLEPEVSGLIIDLRANPGGRVSFGLVDCFLKPGKIVASSLDIRTGERYDLDATVEYFPWPLVVLVDRDSASMSEAFAATIQTHDRGLVIGEQTLGKSVGQTTYPIGDEGELHLVTTEYFYPGRDDGWSSGIQPDVVIAGTDKDREKLRAILEEPFVDLDDLINLDPVLQTALDHLIGTNGGPL